MKNDDVELIQRILTGDQSAFENLIGKYQKRIHSYAWRKTKDFHIAEDITQDTFLQVYLNLDRLEDPTKFSSWLYTILNYLCIAWFRKKTLNTESLEQVDIPTIEAVTYSNYVAAERTQKTVEAQRDLIKKLLAKLTKSDREIITLHYFDDMKLSEIGMYLGVSENTVKSRIHRVRQRLKKYNFMV